MATHKTCLLSLLAVEVTLIALHVVLREPNQTNGSIAFEWHFWISLIFGAFIIFYAFSIRCPIQSCRKQQVFRGLSFFDIHLPSERCHICGASLK
jgi:hypothetical protein